MTFLYLGLYTLILIFIWGFFVVAKLHTDKFKNFSSHIRIVNHILLVFLIILSIIGYVLIFFLPNGEQPTSAKLNGIEDIGNSSEEFDKLNFDEINY